MFYATHARHVAKLANHLSSGGAGCCRCCAAGAGCEPLRPSGARRHGDRPPHRCEGGPHGCAPPAYDSTPGDTRSPAVSAPFPNSASPPLCACSSPRPAAARAAADVDASAGGAEAEEAADSADVRLRRVLSVTGSDIGKKRSGRFGKRVVPALPSPALTSPAPSGAPVAGLARLPGQSARSDGADCAMCLGGAQEGEGPAGACGQPSQPVAEEGAQARRNIAAGGWLWWAVLEGFLTEEVVANRRKLLHVLLSPRLQEGRCVAELRPYLLLLPPARTKTQCRRLIIATCPLWALRLLQRQPPQLLPRRHPPPRRRRPRAQQQPRRAAAREARASTTPTLPPVRRATDGLAAPAPASALLRPRPARSPSGRRR